MKADFGDAVYALFVLFVGLAWATVLGFRSPADEAARVKDEAFCLEHARELSLAWDAAEGWCIYVPRGERVARED